ncbi:3-ketoacyl-ACP reductase [Verminephrobacter aporrectodeae subsp. tuberculatae]|uniref:3-ketoacyl-ACP reductase n=1 Tax=Verminephrobacter aporrectodeae subsp. tuberculatae TaxID=1110392 RepID=A0ABT3KU18_9BURK|nr:3-ketoacyl-ACP reductase [Verminephrobacter aporrectodeae]MCW5321823.1 3-ketoacyl-ACP reductase [Verminephrobacter aporrectodeae subsp. tuberculatae]MCW8163404.1 3-ketoacyl-ACP reductase [Verminephrobacter aporrectodeae subsp. tuberculatae]MCW8167633.1 3-ketoacyl-ACP reductase [Verminephrobacter aporrectodeae subsp. tuberculatae]MCW8206581.1 3-ketoacyl-ACP reductase [Verminephrobacter aporrectodeae subsp. tuberculatae]
MRRTAIVTGASRGIGRASALALAEEGFDVAAVAWRDAQHFDALIADVEALGRRCKAFDLDIRDRSAHAPFLDSVQRQFGDVHCLVNNAGVSVLERGDLLEVGEESYDRCFGVNTRGTFFLTQAVACRMLACGAPAGAPRSVIFVTSSNAVAASVERGEYCMSKSALHMAARLYALRLAPEGIGVYEVQPGLILTGMTAPSKARYDGLIAQGMTAQARWGLPEDVARVIRTMAAGLLPYTVAQEVRVDGGLLIQRF